MADLTVREVPEAGLAALSAALFEAAAASQTIPAKVSSLRAGGWENESVFLLCRNTDAATRNVTVGAAGDTQTAVTVGATTGFAIIPIRGRGLNHAQIPITYSATANLEVALVRMGRAY